MLANFVLSDSYQTPGSVKYGKYGAAGPKLGKYGGKNGK